MSQLHSRIVIKIGTGVLTRAHNGKLDHAMLSRIVQAVSDLKETGREIILVSSGAVGAGMAALNLADRPEETGLLQACAAVGQARLMEIYDDSFRNFRLQIAQLLLTNEDFDGARREENMRNTLSRLLQIPEVLPIINENDSVAVYELKFGDNDKLSAHVAKLIEADLLILLTSVPGLMGPDARDENDIIPAVERLEDVIDFAGEEIGRRSVGGMKSKLEAVGMALEAGIPTIIASGRNPEQLVDLVEGKGVGTRFHADAVARD